MYDQCLLTSFDPSCTNQYDKRLLALCISLSCISTIVKMHDLLLFQCLVLSLNHFFPCVIGIGCWNPAFDVTPAELITGGIVTEFGVFRPEELKEAILKSTAQ